MKIGEQWRKLKNLPVVCTLFNGTLTSTGAFLSIVFVMVVFVLMFFSSSKVALGDTALEAGAMLAQELKVPYEDIVEVRLIDFEDHEMGTRAAGFSNLFSVSGSYYNDEYVIYDAYFSRKNKENCVEVRYTEFDAYVLFNLKDPVETEEMYEKLLALTENN